jgi:hypothetical protein
VDPSDTFVIENLFHEGELEANCETAVATNWGVLIHKYSNSRLLFFFSKESLILNWVFYCKLFYYENICFNRILTIKI